MERQGLSRKTLTGVFLEMWWIRLQALMASDPRFDLVWDKARRRVRSMN